MNKLLIPGAAALALLCSPAVHAQTVVRETTTAAAPLEVTGTVTEYGPDRVIIRQREGVEPVPYAFTRQVEYVDEAGNPVTREVITRDTPVTIRYVQEGDRMLVNRVIVRRRVAAPATTATVTTAAPAPAVTTTQTTTSTTTTISAHDAKEIEKRREKIAKLEREVAEHPGRDGAREDLAEERAKLERLEREIREGK